MATAISLVVMLLIIVCVFFGGMYIGGCSIGRTLADAICKAIEESDLTCDQELRLLEKVREYSKTKK